MNLTILLLAFFVCVFAASPVYAYLDPGTGSMMLQAVIAGIAALGVSIGIFWQRIKSLFSGKKDDNTDNSPDEE